jgi:hypothetical protein
MFSVDAQVEVSAANFWVRGVQIFERVQLASQWSGGFFWLLTRRYDRVVTHRLLRRVAADPIRIVEPLIVLVFWRSGVRGCLVNAIQLGSCVEFDVTRGILDWLVIDHRRRLCHRIGRGSRRRNPRLRNAANFRLSSRFHQLA